MRVSDDLRPEERDIMRRTSGLPIDYPALAVASNIWRAAMAMKLKLERSVLKRYKLSWSGFSTMFIVWVWGPAEVRDIARLQGVSRPTITSNLTMLEKRGLCTRAGSPEDGRLVTASLTPAGEALIKELFPRFNQGEREISTVLNPKERIEIARLLRKVVDGIAGEGAPPPHLQKAGAPKKVKARTSAKRNSHSA
jgi:DNA-binding MarR family transcriptional regulator